MQEIKTTDHFLPLFDSHNPHYSKRYLTWYGGRGAMKSWQVARGLLLRSLQEPKKILCTREYQNSIQESVLSVLEGQARAIGIAGFFEFQNNAIIGKNGSKFIFKGLKNNIDSIKSFEDVDIVWNEEAQATSQKSIDVLYPTIRKPNSQIITTFNPKNRTDPIYQETVANHNPEDSYLCKVTYLDNPWIDDSFVERADLVKKEDSAVYRHIYLGEFDTRRSGTVYATQLAKAREERRITKTSYDPASEVFTSWDLGFADSTAIWWLQFVGRELRWLEYYENSSKPLEHYAELIKSKEYHYKHIGHFLPHDGGHNNIRGESVSKQLMQMGILNQVLPRERSIQSGIELLRKTLCYSVFNESKCQEGLHALDHYAYEWDEDKSIFKQNPRHDWTSHAADAARYAAIAAGKIKAGLNINAKSISFLEQQKSWMG